MESITTDVKLEADELNSLLKSLEKNFNKFVNAQEKDAKNL